MDSVQSLYDQFLAPCCNFIGSKIRFGEKLEGCVLTPERDFTE